MAKNSRKSEKFGWSDAMLLSSLVAFGGYFFYRIAHVDEDYKPHAVAALSEINDAAKNNAIIVPQFPEILEDTALPYRTVKAKVTAYCPEKCCCGPGAKGLTSRGKSAYEFSGVAIDPRAIPYGSELEIPGFEERKFADDTGGAMRQYWENEKKVQIDVRMASHEEAKKWGVKELEVKVYSAKRK